MATYKGINTQGQAFEFEAESSTEALLNTNLGTNSGVQAISTPAPTAPEAPTAPIDRTRSLGSLAKAKGKAQLTEETFRNATREAEAFAAERRQARIDAIDKAFAPRFQRQDKENAAQQSRVDALNFKKGIVGSGVDTTATGEQKGLNEQATQAIEAEKGLEINKAFGFYDQLATERAKANVEKTQAIAEGNVAKYQDLYDTALESLKSFGKGGVTIDDLRQSDPNIIENLKEVGGLSDFEIASILAENNPEVNAKTEFKDGTMFQYYVDPKSGEMVVNTQQADLQGKEEFKSVDGIGYGVKTDANGNLVMRPLTSKTRTSNPDKNYTSSNIPDKVNSELSADIQVNGASLDQLYDAYPEVSPSYINSQFRALTKTTSSSSDKRDIGGEEIEEK